MGTMGAGLQQEHQVGLFEDEEPQEAFFSTGWIRDAEKIDFAFFAGLVLGLPFSLDEGFVLATFSLCCFPSFCLLCLPVPLLLAHLCFFCCRSVPPLSGCHLLSVSWVRAWLASSPQPAG